MSYDYIEKIKELIENTEVNISDVFEYQGTPLEEEFDNTFQFYQETLEANYKYGIEPAIWFFNTYHGNNARAGKNNNYYLISMNMGGIKFRIDTFLDPNKDIFEGLTNWKEFETNLDNPLDRLIFDFTLHFTAYHELAHLIQMSDFLSDGIQEDFDSTEGYIERRHILEIDADIFACLQLGSHVFQYAESMFGNDSDIDKLEMLIVLAGSAVQLYLLSFDSSRLPLYFKEGTHPHALIRNAIVSMELVEYCVMGFEKKGKKLKLNRREISHKVLDLTRQIEERVFGEKILDAAWSPHKEQMPQIIKFIVEMSRLMEGDSTLAIHKRNAFAVK